MGWGYNDYGWRPYVPMAQRRANAARALPKLLKGETPSPVVIKGRKMATSFWGAAWCEHLEGRADIASRLPRGRTYARNGSVVHLHLEKGRIKAYVQGTDLYEIEVTVDALPQKSWKTLIQRCAGQVSSVVELLQGRLPKAALEAIADPAAKLFPSPAELKYSCSCPDWASMCKHVAAVLYGVGARLDTQPELFFELRGVDWNELVTTSVAVGELSKGPAKAEALEGADLSGLFGIELDTGTKPKGRKKAATPKAKAAPRTPAKPRGSRAKRPKVLPTITSSELLARGVSRSAVQSWLRTGVLQRTSNPGLYQTTEHTEARIAEWLARRSRQGV